jgi:hypothetical protein
VWSRKKNAREIPEISIATEWRRASLTPTQTTMTSSLKRTMKKSKDPRQRERRVQKVDHGQFDFYQVKKWNGEVTHFP